MAVLSAAVSALSTFYQDSLDPFDREQVEICTARLLVSCPRSRRTPTRRRSGGLDMLFVLRADHEQNCSTATVRLLGSSHSSYDPRAAIVKKAAQQVLSRAAKSDPLLDIALHLEETALSDDSFIDRKLYPDVDFYTGLIFSRTPKRHVSRAPSATAEQFVWAAAALWTWGSLCRRG